MRFSPVRDNGIESGASRYVVSHTSCHPELHLSAKNDRLRAAPALFATSRYVTPKRNHLSTQNARVKRVGCHLNSGWLRTAGVFRALFPAISRYYWRL